MVDQWKPQYVAAAFPFTVPCATGGPDYDWKPFDAATGRRREAQDLGNTVDR